MNASGGRRELQRIIPSETSPFPELKPGQKVNIEVDLIARYLERLINPETA
jgi:riboflavin synthase alpha subunit